jgi:hypothetical protein
MVDVWRLVISLAALVAVLRGREGKRFQEGGV